MQRSDASQPSAGAQRSDARGDARGDALAVDIPQASPSPQLSDDAPAAAATVAPGAKRRSGAPKRVIPFRCGEFAPSSDDDMDEFLGRRGCVQRLSDWAGQVGRGESKGSRDERRAQAAATSASAPASASAQPAPHANFKPSVRQLRVAEYRRLKFGSNRIRSARYTVLNFLPLNLFEQMAPWRKPANFYFLCIAILQSINSISTTNGRPSILVPLCFVLAVTAIKDALEDYHRAKSDRAKNDAVYTVWRPVDSQGGSCDGRGAWLKEYSKDILVGDLVRVEENHRIPADVLLVASGMAKGTHCFVDTKDLDGETNLKPKFVPSVVLKYLTDLGGSAPAAAGDIGSRSSASSSGSDAAADGNDDDANAAAASDAMLRRLERVSGSLECEQPNGNMSEFHGTVSIGPDGSSASASASSASGPQRQNVALDSLILSECVLRSTPWIVGLVVFTGDETKLRSNAKKQLGQVRVKQTRVFRLTNRLFVFMALAQFALCLSAAVACAVMQSRVQNDAFYLYFRDAAATAGVLQFFTWIILCKDFVPISLYVSMELVQFWQALFMGIDKSMSVQQIRVRNDDDDEDEDERDDGIEVEEEEQMSTGKQGFEGGFDAPAHAAPPTSPPSDASPAGQKQISGDKGAAGAAGAAGAVVPSKRPRVVHETIYAKAQTSRLNEELSQVSYIFSDKTGTLTQNSMIFKKCVIGGRQYGRTSTQAGVIRRAKMEGRDVGAALATFEAERVRQERQRAKEGQAKFPHVEFDEAEKVLAVLAGGAAAQAKDQSAPLTSGPAAGSAAALGHHSSAPSSSSTRSHADEVREYLRALALNNAVFPKVDALRSGAPDARAKRLSSNSGSQGRAKSAPLYDLSSPATRAVMALESSSPDETALCYFAQFLGVELFSRAGGRTRLRIREGPPAAVLASTTAADAAAADAADASNEEQPKSAPAPAPAQGAEAHFEDYLDVCVLDFSAKRKRMTVLVEPLDPNTGKPSGRILVYCKGADSFVYPLLAGAQSGGQDAAAAGNDLSDSRQGDSDDKAGSSAAAASALADPVAGPGGPGDWAATSAHLVEFGGESLRTLVVAAGEREHSWWFGPEGGGGDGGLKAEYERTQRSQGDAEKGHVAGSCSSACALCAIETRIEREAGLRLSGVTAIEDLLQEGVGAALRRLLAARIGVWMLTGDNVSTATNIAISCNLLEADMEKEGRLFTLDRDDASSVANIAAVIREARRTIAQMRAADPAAEFGLALHSDAWKLLYDAEDEPTSGKKQGRKDQKANKKLVAHTPAEVALQQSTLTAFFDLAASCRSVIASRLEPREKAAIVEEMRRRTGLVCLAIGDGNNDEQMIRAADIGVGIRGVEGTSAVASSDYALCQFRHLTRLLLSYGHLHYRRMALLIHFIFYKSSTLVWTAFFFGSLSMFSAQSLYLDWTFQLFNIAYTSLPILVVAVLDWDLSMDALEQRPLIYSATRGGTYFSPASIARWLLAGLVDSALCFWLVWLTFAAWPSAPSPDQDVGFAAMGLVVYTCVCMVVNLKLAFFVRSWTWLHGLAFALSIAVYWSATLVFNSTSFFAIGGINYHGALSFVARQPRFWLTLLLCLASSAALTLLYLAVYELFWPRTPVQVYYEAAQIGADMDEIDAQYAQIVARVEAESGSESELHDGGGKIKEVQPRQADAARSSAESDEEAQQGTSQRDQPPVSVLQLQSPQGATGKAQPAAAARMAATSPSAAPFSPVPLLGAATLGSPQPPHGFLYGAGAAQAPLRVTEPAVAVATVPVGRGQNASPLAGQRAPSLVQRPPSDSAAAGTAPAAEWPATDRGSRRSSSLPAAHRYRYASDSASTREETAAAALASLTPQPQSRLRAADSSTNGAAVAPPAGQSMTESELSGRPRSSSAPGPPTPLPPLRLHLGELTPRAARAAYSGFAFSHTPTGKLWAVQMQHDRGPRPRWPVASAQSHLMDDAAPPSPAILIAADIHSDAQPRADHDSAAARLAVKDRAVSDS